MVRKPVAILIILVAVVISTLFLKNASLKSVEERIGLLQKIGAEDITCFSPNAGAVDSGRFRSVQCMGFIYLNPTMVVEQLTNLYGSPENNLDEKVMCFRGQVSICISMNTYARHGRTFLRVF